MSSAGSPGSSPLSQSLLVLALCPALAVSDTVANALGLGIIVIITITTATLAAVALKRLPDEIRWPIHMLFIAAIVSCCALLLDAWAAELYRSLGVFLPLLAANALILLHVEDSGRASSRLSLSGAMLSGLRTGATVALVLLTLGVAREIVGHGSVLHNADVMLGGWASAARLQLFRADMGFLLAMLPPGAFIACGLLLAGWNWVRDTKSRKDARTQQQRDAGTQAKNGALLRIP